MITLKKSYAEAKDKGLRPLINDLQNYINNFLMSDIDPLFEFVFTGTDNSEDPLIMAQRMKVEVESFKTINEARCRERPTTLYKVVMRSF